MKVKGLNGYIPMLDSMAEPDGSYYYCGHPVGACLKHASIKNGEFKKDIQLCLKDSDTWVAFSRQEKIGDRFVESRAVAGKLVWKDKLGSKPRDAENRILLDVQSGIFRDLTDRPGAFGCASDVLHCFYVQSESGKWELFNPSRSKKPTLYFSAEEDIEHAAEQLAKHDPTTRKALIDARRGQGKFRRDLIFVWGKCAVSRCDHVDLLRASHIKPWRPSTDEERLDRFNGLLLAPNLDAAFDRGLISFKDDGHILISPKLSDDTCEKLGLHQGMKLVNVYKKNRPYLAIHREIHNFNSDE